MEDLKDRLKRLKEQRKQISHTNFKEVLEENEQLKRPANWEKRLERNLKKIASEEEKQKAEELGKDYVVRKSLDVQAKDLEKWERIEANKKQPKHYIPQPSEKEGVERMVEAVEKQIETRSKHSRRRRFDDEADVDYINERNMKFNKKLEKFYGNYTNEIKQNFERGTAI